MVKKLFCLGALITEIHLLKKLYSTPISLLKLKVIIQVPKHAFIITLNHNFISTHNIKTIAKYVSNLRVRIELLRSVFLVWHLEKILIFKIMDYVYT